MLASCCESGDFGTIIVCWLCRWNVSSKLELSLCGIVDLGAFERARVLGLGPCASCGVGVIEFGFGKEFNAWSMSVICKRKRSGSDSISLFVGIGFWSVA